MAGYYIISSPSQRIKEHETEYAIKSADLRSVAECVVSAQNAAMYGEEFTDPCVEKYEITSQYICMNENYNIVSCDFENAKSPEFNFIITTSYVLPDTEYNSMLEILEKHYPDAGTLGVFVNSALMSAGSVSNRLIPNKIIESAKLQPGQLIYIMQYTIPKEPIEYKLVDGSDIVCPTGTMKTFRFGRWQCIEYNYKISCTGDTIWDPDLMECVSDESRKPLCANNQTAVMVDEIWECVDPFQDQTCPENMVARLNYSTLTWECVEDPNTTKKVKKCDNITIMPETRGIVGATLRVRSVSCTDCETPIIDEETCETYCVPAPNKLTDPRCYAGDISECSGINRGIYFGFSPKSRIDKIDAVPEESIPFDRDHSQNRMFNCMDCGDSEIDTEKSVPPYTAICK